MQKLCITKETKPREREREGERNGQGEGENGKHKGKKSREDRENHKVDDRPFKETGRVSSVFTARALHFRSIL